ncbi:MAG: hypothetical protein Q7R58_01295 [bacterium]|nr:hypothetical protein [bacterium]
MDVVTKAIGEDRTQDNPEAATAAIALINVGLEKGHPSYYNTQFAVAAFFLDPGNLGLYAWRMVANGLGGYWQWQSHNGGSFSITSALLRLNLLTAEEAKEVAKFVVCETHPGCHYVVVQETFLARIVDKFKLPTKNPRIGGRDNFSLEELRRREYYQGNCESGWVSSDGRPRFEAALRSM